MSEINKKVEIEYKKNVENEVILEINIDNKSKSKENILKMIDKAHNILYNAENIEGEDALNDIMNFLFLKLIQNLLSDKEEEGKIDLLNKKYYESLFDDTQLNEILSYFVNFKNLTVKELKTIRCLDESIDCIREMGEILKTHPITKMIYTEPNFIKAKKTGTIKSLIEVIDNININEFFENEDVIGDIYEHIINAYVKKGSKLGQYFTPRPLMNLTLNYIKDRIKKITKKINDVKFYDSCMGTAGWLVSGFNILQNKNILLSGGEIKSTTFQYGLMNLILTLKKFPHDVKCESSLTHVNNNKHHIILTNPPFQTDKKFKELKENFISDNYTKNNKINIDDIYKLKNNSPPIQFLELNLYKLEENGLCIIVLPYGDLFFGSSHKKSREHFMNTCNITDIILIQGGTFTHTGIKTCVIIFEKNKSTEKINFIEANKECNKLTKLFTLSIEEIKSEGKSSWFHQDYIKNEDNINTDIEWIEFGEIFTLEKGKIQSSKVVEDKNGIAVMVTQSKNIDDYKKINTYQLDNKNLFIGNIDSGKKFCINYYNGKCDFTNLLSVCKINDNYKEKIDIKFYYYYLKSIQEELTNKYLKGSCNLSLDKDNFYKMKIPLPLIEQQNKIVSNLTLFDDHIETNNKKIDQYDKIKKCVIDSLTFRCENKQLLEEICEFINGKKRNVSESIENGKYKFITCSIHGYSYLNEYDFEDKALIINSINGSGKCMIYCTDKYSTTNNNFHFKVKNKKILTEYIYYYLYHNINLLENGFIGSNQKKISKEYLNNLEIIIPSLEIQEKIIKKCEYYDKQIETLQKENEEFKNNSYIKDILQIV